jgi:hypothetical protein
MIHEHSLLVTVTVTVSMNFMKNIAQKVNKLTQVMVRFFHPLELVFSGTPRRDCLALAVAWGRISPLCSRLLAGLIALIDLRKFGLLQTSPKSICFPGSSAK